jgi:hypothetical protein
MVDVVSRRGDPADAVQDARPAARVAALTTFRRAVVPAPPYGFATSARQHKLHALQV